MNRSEMEKTIDIGHDVLFTLFGKKYAICPDDNGPSIAECFTEQHEAFFHSGKELLDGYIIDGKPLGELLEHIVIDDIY